MANEPIFGREALRRFREEQAPREKASGREGAAGETGWEAACATTGAVEGIRQP
ncbi:MAG: hypothetical protein IT165_34800 [Bryobacterales bacterium]|nr:hypothetical protein [Bryobacterales bacterium]